MSWICQYLLRNKEIITSEPDIDSDQYNDLLVIEKKIEELHEEGFLSDLDLYIIDLVSDGRPIKDLEKSLDRSRITISKTFIQICNRIAYFLGGYFTDEGFLENMKQNYRLSDEDIEKLNSYINGKFKHKLMKRKLEINEII